MSSAKRKKISFQSNDKHHLCKVKKRHSVHYWVSCAINKGGFFEIAFVVVVDTHLPRFETLVYVLPHFDALTHVVIRTAFKRLLRSAILSS